MLHPLVRPGWVRSAGPTLGVAAGSAGPVHLEGRGGSEGGAWSWDPAPTGRGSPWHRPRGPGAAAAQRAPFTGEDRGRATRGPAGVGVRSQAGPWCQAGTPRHPLHGGRPPQGRRAGWEVCTPERLDDAGEPGRLAFFILFLGSLCNTLRFAQEWGLLIG